MGTPVNEPRRYRCTVRFTEKEYAQLKAQMANMDYLSVARYIRDRSLDKQIVVRRNIVLTDRNLRNQINNMTSHIERIGVDYNQATKKFNSLAKASRPDGSPVINARSANYYLKKIFAMTKDLKREVDMLVDLVDRANLDGDRTAPQGEGTQ